MMRRQKECLQLTVELRKFDVEQTDRGVDGRSVFFGATRKIYGRKLKRCPAQYILCASLKLNHPQLHRCPLSSELSLRKQHVFVSWSGHGGDRWMCSLREEGTLESCIGSGKKNQDLEKRFL